MKVIIPSQLRAYTQAGEVQAAGATVGEVIADLDRRYPGMRFRMIDEQDQIRTHIRIFVNQENVGDLDYPLREDDVVRIIGALSGG